MWSTWIWENLHKASGTVSARDPNIAGNHESIFDIATQTMSMGLRDQFYVYALSDPCNPPENITLGFGNTAGYSYFGYWGTDAWSHNPRSRIGNLPPAGQWVRLSSCGAGGLREQLGEIHSREPDENGRQSEPDLALDLNGEKSIGKLTIDIQQEFARGPNAGIECWHGTPEENHGRSSRRTPGERAGGGRGHQRHGARGTRIEGPPPGLPAAAKPARSGQVVGQSRGIAGGPRLIAADTSALRRYWSGARGRDVELVDGALAREELIIAPVVVTELLSDAASRTLSPFILALPLLEMTSGYWGRAGELRARLRAEGHKAKLADTLIAQSCIDHHIPLVTYDRDFRHFVKAGLKLL